jgi:hypothetical protein
MSEILFKAANGKEFTAQQAPKKLLEGYEKSEKVSPEHRAAAEFELNRRAELGDDSPEPAAATALAKLSPQQMIFSLADPAAVNELIKSIKSQVILLTPTPIVTDIPDGHSIESTMVTYDKGKDFWTIGGNQFLKGYKVNEVSVALNVSWHKTKREDYDNSVLNVWVFTVAADVQNFDGSLRQITGTYELDLREGSETVKGLKPGDLSNKRKCGLRLAESGAKFRAICSGCALQRTIAREDLDKPFLILRLKLTGNYADAELRRDYSRMLAARALGLSMPALYPNAPQLSAPRVVDIEDDPTGPDGSEAPE